MILILSTSYDFDTQIVIDWLRNFNVSFIRVNDEDILFGDTTVFFDVLNSKNSFFEVDKKKVYFREINTIWFRKFGFLNSYKKHYGSNSDIFKFLNRELITFREILCKEFKDKFWLYNKNIDLNKIQVLKAAKICGLKIPVTIITNSRTTITKNDFLKNNSFITKAIGETANINSGKYGGVMYTKKVDLTKLRDKFAVSLLQSEIEKIYEIRTFFINDRFFSMAVFSQKNDKTSQDFRNYDQDNPNRTVPYKLPSKIISKLTKLTQKLSLNTGSIDLIRSVDGEYYFLEVNPSGQFGMTSLPCNYNLHKEVALFLIEKNEKN